jgi:beta-N-acetylhexosaminidase
MKRKNYITCCLLFILSLSVQSGFAQKANFISTLTEQNHWVDSVYKKLSRKERIGQLFYVRAHTNKGKHYEDSVGR